LKTITSEKKSLFEYMGFALKVDMYCAIFEKYQNRFQKAW